MPCTYGSHAQLLVLHCYLAVPPTKSCTSTGVAFGACCGSKGTESWYHGELVLKLKTELVTLYVPY